ncbi:MAG: TIGR02453 family protein [Bacteroidota bacterium]
MSDSIPATAADLQLSPNAFELLDGLAGDNSRTWYDAHGDDFKADVRTPFARILEASTAALASTAIPLKGSTKTMFRQHRDTRFSADKRPYSEYVAGVMTPSGSRREDEGVLYLRLDASGGFVSAGFKLRKASEMTPMRQRMIEEPESFRHVLSDLHEVGLDLSRDGALSGMPRGFSHYRDHEFSDYLRLPSLLATRTLAPAHWTERDIVDTVVQHAHACEKLLRFGQG